MGYAICLDNCFSCRKLFGFNPMKVPSIKDKEGVRQPICRECIDAANLLRIRNGLAPATPAPDAYEACDESELNC